MIAIVGTIIPTKCTDTEVRSLIRAANGNVLTATNMLAIPNLGQRIARREQIVNKSTKMNKYAKHSCILI